MKNSNLFPFERNKYFYGKLLSVDDFELEQKYMNDKRRLLNRFLFGFGVVSGLYVVNVDEQTISVEMGFALDSWGREIIVDEPVLTRLSQVEGYEYCMEDEPDALYLCMEYQEKEVDQVHNIAGGLSAVNPDGDRSFSRIREGYRLFLTNQEPDETEKDLLSPRGMYQKSVVIWQDEDIRITQTVPKFVRAGAKTELALRIENHGRRTLSFSYDLILNGMVAEDGKAKLTVHFDEILLERTGVYEITFPLLAANMAGEEGVISLDPESVSFKLSGEGVPAEFESKKMTIAIVDKDEIDALREAYYKAPLEEIATTGYMAPIYLAKIGLVGTANSYVIEKIENVPFHQHVSNNMLDKATYDIMRSRGIGEEGVSASSGTGEGSGLVRTVPEGVKISQGVAEIFIKGGGQRGDKFFTSQITHDLGLGRVTIVLGMERDSGSVVYGSSEIFEKKEEPGIDAELAAKVNEEDGSFVIGARLLSGVKGGKIRVHWTAIRDAKEIVTEKSEKSIFIKPNLLELSLRQSYRLEAVCKNMVEKAVTWSVKDDGGFIDETGLYTAPNIPGVYEVVAQSVAFPEIKASIFVVVRER